MGIEYGKFPEFLVGTTLFLVKIKKSISFKIFIRFSLWFLKKTMASAIKAPVTDPNKKIFKTAMQPSHAPIAARSLTSPPPIPPRIKGIMSRQHPVSIPFTEKSIPSYHPEISILKIIPKKIAGIVRVLGIILFLISVHNANIINRLQADN